MYNPIWRRELTDRSTAGLVIEPLRFCSHTIREFAKGLKEDVRDDEGQKSGPLER
jgi:hypothetical protein